MTPAPTPAAAPITSTWNEATKLNTTVINQIARVNIKPAPAVIRPAILPPALPMFYNPGTIQHNHFGQGFGGDRADGAVMGPNNWQARNFFSQGSLRADGVRWQGRCCGDQCRNGGLGCCGKCPRCIDCPFTK